MTTRTQETTMTTTMTTTTTAPEADAQSPGRGPGGKPRNFRAMGEAKLAKVISQLREYGADADALVLAESVAASRWIEGLI
jgi:hypothetical protein